MHVCQIMLVEAETDEDAFEFVESQLGEAPSWSDWHNANNAHHKDFAGRWSGLVFKANPESDTEENAPNNHLQYSADPALAEAVIEKYLQQRLDDIRALRTKALDLSTYVYDPYKNDLFEMDTYYTKKLAELLSNDWTSDSGLFDLTHYTANLHHFIERVKRAPEKQWLIPVDLHY